ncbi:MAG: T9SS type A sorting domain-containing protein [Candidatus Kapaibacteriales bacterium]
MKNILYFLSIVCLTSLSIFSQTKNPFWDYYFNGNDVTAVQTILNNSSILIGTRQSGLALFNLDSMTYEGFLSKVTLPSIPTNNIHKVVKEGNDTTWICTDQGLIRLTFDSIIIFDTTNSGLPSNYINDVSFDYLGGKWIATDAGLVYNLDTLWVVYTTQNSGLPSDVINFVKVDILGNIWVCTADGLAMHDINDWYVWNTNNSSLPDDFITFIEFEPNGTKWIGTLNGGLVNWAGNNMLILNTSNSPLPSNSILCMAFDTAGTKWVGTDNGLAHFGGPGGWEVFNTTNSKLSNNSINFIHIDSYNRKFVATRDSLTIIIDTNFYVLSVANSKLPTNYVTKVVEQNNLVKWIATPTGLVHFNGKHWTVYNSFNSSLICNFISDISLDDNENLWIATDSGLYVFKDNQWVHFLQDSLGLPSNNVFRVLPAGLYLFVGTDSGLAKLEINTNQWTRFDTLYGGLLKSNISALAIDSSKNLYVGLGTNGLAILKVDTLIHYDYTNSPLANFYISSLFVDDHQSLYIGTFGLGLVKLDSNWTIFNPNNSNFPDYSVHFITKSFDGTYWIATRTHGIAARKDTNWILFNEENSPLTSNFVNSIYIDFSGNKWLSTRNGLLVFDSDTLKPELRINPFTASLCMNDNLLIYYFTFGKFNANNEFLVLLSDSAGSFNNSILIGRYVGVEAQPVLTRIPNDIPSSDFYRIKIVSTSPILDGLDNGSDVSIHTISKPKIFGDTVACSSSQQTFWTEPVPLTVYTWRVEGGRILGTNFGDTILVQWDSLVGNKVILVASNQYNCIDSTSLNIRISTLPGRIIYGSPRACVGDSYIYSTTDSSNITNVWTVKNGTLLKKYSNHAVAIRWDSVGIGTVVLRRINHLGCVDSVKLDVNVFNSPNSRITGSSEQMINSIAIYRTIRDFPGITNKWSVSGGMIIGNDDDDSVVIGWNKYGYGKVKLNQITLNGCINSSEFLVKIFEPTSIEGDTIVCEHNETYFETLSNLGAINQWNVIGGNFITSAQNRRVWIKWGNHGVGQIKLVQTFSGTNFIDSSIKRIVIRPMPPKPTIADSGDYLKSSEEFGNQWYWNGKPLIGDTNQIIYPLKTGYYSVQVTTAPGCVSEMSDAVYFVSDVEEISKLAIFKPNPTTGIVYISPLDNVQITRISIFDEFGRKLKELDGAFFNSSIEINLDGLPNGIYLIQIESPNTIERVKVVLVR